MTSNVVSLNGEPIAELGEPQEFLIKAIEQLLEKAKSGELQSFIGTGFVTDGCRISVWCDLHKNVYEMLGAINWLEHEYVSRQELVRDA
jgi:hypothetical protein